MFSNRLAVAALGLACVTAAAGGSYLATRHNVTERAIPAAVAAEAPTAADAPTATQAVPQAAPIVNSELTSPAPAPPAVVTQPPPAARPTQAPRRAARPANSATPATRARVEPAAPASERTAAAPAPSPVVVEPPALARVDERPLEPMREVEPPPTVEELTVAADSVIGLQTETTLTSERARVEDRIEARVVRDVRADGRVAIPAGSRVLGSVILVERGGRMRDRARIGIRFHTLSLGDGTRVPITTETIYRLGETPGDNSAKKIGGGAVAGAILGAILGGGKGAAIGATTGAAGGSAVVMAGERSEAVFESGQQITARILSPITLTVDR